VPRDLSNWFVIWRVRYTVKPRFNKVPRDLSNWFVIWRVHYIVKPRFNKVPRDLSNWFVIWRVRYIVKPRFNKVPRDLSNWFVISRVRYTVKPRFNKVPRDWGNWFVISRFFPYITLLLGWKMSFVIPRTSLHRGSLNRGSTVFRLMPWKHTLTFVYPVSSSSEVGHTHADLKIASEWLK